MSNIVPQRPDQEVVISDRTLRLTQNTGTVLLGTLGIINVLRFAFDAGQMTPIAGVIFLILAVGWFYFIRTFRQDRIRLKLERTAPKPLAPPKKSKAQLRAEALERAQTWPFKLVREPEIDWTDLPLRYELTVSKVRRLRNWGLEQIVANRDYVHVVLYLQPRGLELLQPVKVRVRARDLFAAKYDAGELMAVFPEATVNDAGDITDYGAVAVIHGSALKLPIYKDEDDHLAEAAWRWQIPQNGTDLRAKPRPPANNRPL